MTDAETETETVIVVGMNRTRLLKIMAMVNEEEEGPIPDHGEHDQAVEYVPCVAVMSSYEGQDGEDIRYLSNFVYHDGSPMNRFFDDEGFRESLKTIVMVGYEWRDSDEELIQKYFEAFLFTTVEIHCVKPNTEFSSLGEEMQHYKNLTPQEKDEHSNNHTMGPKKMKRFILDSVKALRPIDSTDVNEDVPAANDDAENDVGPAEIQHDEQEQEQLEQKEEPQRIPKAIDDTVTSFACRMCRTLLLSENHLSEEIIDSQHSFQKGHIGNSKTTGGGSQSLFCAEVVLEWLAPEGTQYDVEGKLTCPNCGVKVGHWNWSGACFYGTWVVPAIQIPLGKIDVVLPLSERNKATSIAIVSPKAF